MKTFLTHVHQETAKIEHDNQSEQVARLTTISFEVNGESIEDFDAVLLHFHDNTDFAIGNTGFTDLTLLDADFRTLTIKFQASLIIGNKKWSKFTGKWEDYVGP